MSPWEREHESAVQDFVLRHDRVLAAEDFNS
jgi:hypothetical protein